MRRSSAPPSSTSPTVPGATQVATLEATDGDLEDAMGGALAWTIQGGTDRGLFDLTPAGVLSFKAAPDAANPGDADADGVYELQVRVTDGYNPVDADIEVRVAVPAPTLSIADAEGAEDEGVEFTVTLSATSTADVTATWTASIESGDTATAADLTATTTGMVTVAAGATTTTFTVPVANDTTVEDDQTFTVTLSGVSPSSLAQLAADPTATGTINDPASTDATLSSLVVNDGTSNLTLDPAFVSTTTTYEVSVAASVDEVTMTPVTNHASANFEIRDQDDDALADADAMAAGHQVAVPVGQTYFLVRVTAEDDTTTRNYERVGDATARNAHAPGGRAGQQHRSRHRLCRILKRQLRKVSAPVRTRPGTP